MREAYIETINDLRIALSGCSWYQFRLITHYSNEIKKYESLLQALNPKD